MRYINTFIRLVLGLFVVMTLFITVVLIWSYANPEKSKKPVEVTVQSFDKLTSITAQIGDTLGGIIGVVLGFITLIYVIETFKDQSRVNSHSKSTDNLHIILDLLKESSEITKSLTFEGRNDGQALAFIKVRLSFTSPDMPIFFIDDPATLNNILRLLESIVLTTRIQKSLNIEKEHERVIDLKINELLKGYVDILSYVGKNYIKLCEYANEQKKADFIYAIDKLKLFLNEAQELGILGVIHDDEIEIVDIKEIKPLTKEEFEKNPDEIYLGEIYSKLEKRAFKVNLVNKKNASF